MTTLTGLAHPIGCSDASNTNDPAFFLSITNQLPFTVVFDFVGPSPACTDTLLPSAQSASEPQRMKTGETQLLKLKSGSVILALENGNTNHIVAWTKSTAANSTWSITTDANPPSSGPNVGAIAGGVIGAIVFLALLVGGFFWFRRRNSAASSSGFNISMSAFSSKNKETDALNNVEYSSTVPEPPARLRGATYKPAEVEAEPGQGAFNGASLGRPLPRSNTVGTPANSTVGSLGRPLPRSNTSPRSPTAATTDSLSRPAGAGSLGRPLPNRSANATPNMDSLGRPVRTNTNNTTSASLNRLPRGTSTTTAVAPPVPSIPTTIPAASAAVEESYYYSAEPVDPTAPGSRLRLRYPHNPTMEDELRLNKGDIVEMLEVYEDGWCMVRVVMSGLRGVTRRGDEGMIPVGVLEIEAVEGQRKVLTNVKKVVPLPAQQQQQQNLYDVRGGQYGGSWTDYTKQRKRESSLYSMSMY
ncbi:hypothetical protein BJ741DRAFT_592315 [Chytriomyces cf. hyalinus JEL632]|nr:hypothetical protein BJ741DRAFT_592315 [Chytriomyces cf. hyalinus JEL632]